MPQGHRCRPGRAGISRQGGAVQPQRRLLLPLRYHGGAAHEPPVVREDGAAGREGARGRERRADHHAPPRRLQSL